MMGLHVQSGSTNSTRLQIDEIDKTGIRYLFSGSTYFGPHILNFRIMVWCYKGICDLVSLDSGLHHLYCLGSWKPSRLFVLKAGKWA